MRLLHLLKPIKVEQASTVSVVISKIFATDFPVPPMIPTVDGRNPANQLIWRIYHYLQGFYLSQLVQDFFHQQ